MQTQTTTKPLAQSCAERLAQYLKRDFDPRRDESWNVADKLWRAALLTRDAHRSQS